MTILDKRKELFMNGPEIDRSKVRVVKGADRLKSGVIAIEKGNGEVLYRCPCDRCEMVAEAPFPPKANRDFLCRPCMRIAKRGNIDTRHEHRRGESTFVTACYECGEEERTDFMPLRDKEFYCSKCYGEMRDEMRKERQASRQATRFSDAAEDEEAPQIVRPQAEAPGDVEVHHTAAPMRGEAQEERLPDAPRRRGPARSRKIKKLGQGPNQHFLVRCDGCPNEVEVKFVPSEEEAFYCKSCFGNEDIAAALRGGGKKSKPKYDVRTFHNAECVECGKVETVDFRPNPNNPYICDGCFQNRRMRS